MFRAIPAIALMGGVCVPATAHDHVLPQSGESARYICADGRHVEILFGGGDAVVAIGDAVAQLRRDPTAVRELYIGDGWTWSVTGKRSGELTRPAAPKGVVCHVG